MASPAEQEAMRRAVALAAAGLGETSPNPSVGCVLLDAAGRVVGEGRTAPPGGPHAEVRALESAGSAAAGGTAVVTLEPCNHVGRTGRCVGALLEAGVRRVVVALRDPNPAAAGGIEALESAGVEVEAGVLATEARAVTGPWLRAVRTGRPYLVWKYAATLDGRVAATAAEVGAGADGRVDLAALMSKLYARDVRYALLEGGPTLAGAFLGAGLVDEVIGYVAPKLLGAGAAALGTAGIASLDAATELELVDVARVGPDLRLTAVVVKEM